MSACSYCNGTGTWTGMIVGYAREQTLPCKGCGGSGFDDQTNSFFPAVKVKQSMPIIHQKAWDVLKASNKEMPVKRDLLFEYIRPFQQGLTTRALRLIVEELIDRYGKCIASSEQGWYRINHSYELEPAIAYLKKKALALHDRAKRLEQNFQPVANTELKGMETPQE